MKGSKGCDKIKDFNKKIPDGYPVLYMTTPDKKWKKNIITFLTLLTFLLLLFCFSFPSRSVPWFSYFLPHFVLLSWISHFYFIATCAIFRAVFHPLILIPWFLDYTLMFGCLSCLNHMFDKIREVGDIESVRCNVKHYVDVHSKHFQCYHFDEMPHVVIYLFAWCVWRCNFRPVQSWKNDSRI